MSDDESHLTWVNGRAFRNESRELSPKSSCIPDDLARMRARSAEAAEFRQAVANRNLARALKLGAALKASKGG